MAELPSATDADFEGKVLKSPTPVLVDFYTTFCGPCMKMKPMLAELAQELAGRLSVVQVDATEAAETAATYGVMSVPTFVLFVGGEVKETLTGSVSKAGLLGAIEPHLGG